MRAEESTEEEIEGGDELIDLSELFGGASPESEVWGPGSLAYFGPTSRVILLTGEVNETLSASIISQLLELDKRDQETPITIYINTVGGSVSEALAIFDMMRMVSAPIITIATGKCMSAGLLLLQGGDLRGTTPGTRMMYHEPIMEGQAGSHEDMKSLTENYLWAKKAVNKIIRSKSTISKKNWKRHFKDKTSYYFGAKTALKWGLVDEILQYADKNVEISTDGQ